MTEKLNSVRGMIYGLTIGDALGSVRILLRGTSLNIQITGTFPRNKC